MFFDFPFAFTKDLQPGGINHQMRDFTPGERFETDINRLCALADTGVIRAEIAHLVIDSTGLKVFGEGEWKVKKHGQERRRIWRKLHLAVDSKTHEIICADLSLNNVTISVKMESIKPCAARRVSLNTRLMTSTVVMARSE